MRKGKGPGRYKGVASEPEYQESKARALHTVLTLTASILAPEEVPSLQLPLDTLSLRHPLSQHVIFCTHAPLLISKPGTHPLNQGPKTNTSVQAGSCLRVLTGVKGSEHSVEYL